MKETLTKLFKNKFLAHKLGYAMQTQNVNQMLVKSNFFID